MKIIGEDFELEKIKDTIFFDLKLPKIINKGKSNERTEMETVGYGFTFENAIKRIVAYRLDQEEGTFTLKQYIDLFEHIVDNLKMEIE